MQRFISKKDDMVLPMATRSQGGPMGSGKRPPLLPKAEPFTYGSWFWVILSVFTLVMGIRYAANPTSLRVLSCDAETCTLRVMSASKNLDETLRFPRGQLKESKARRIKYGKIRDTSGMSRKEIRKLGYSYSITFVRDGADGEAEEIPMTTQSIGRKRPTKMAETINSYVKDPSEHSLYAEEKHGFGTAGIIMATFGIMSLLFALMFGQFADPKPRRPGASSRVTKKRSY